jgi:hypothetical protein
VVPTQEGWSVGNEAGSLGKRESAYPESYATGYEAYMDAATKKIKDD